MPTSLDAPGRAGDPERVGHLQRLSHPLEVGLLNPCPSELAVDQVGATALPGGRSIGTRPARSVRGHSSGAGDAVARIPLFHCFSSVS